MERKVKHFRSSKNLKTLDLNPNPKEQNNLRMKIKQLQEQISLLQSSNLNIFAPISQIVSKEPSPESLISKLRTQILILQQQMHNLKSTIKKLESEKQILKNNYQSQIKQLKSLIESLETQKKSLTQELLQTETLLEQQKSKRKQIQREMIELRVENKFLKEDISTLRLKFQNIQKKYDEIHQNVLSVTFNSRIMKAKTMSITAIQTSELHSLKSQIFSLQSRIRQLLEPKQQRVITSIRKEDIGEQIVRLKKNIDLQLGLKGNQESTKSFLQAYRNANDKFKELISNCQVNK